MRMHKILCRYRKLRRNSLIFKTLGESFFPRNGRDQSIKGIPTILAQFGVHQNPE